MIPYVMVRMSSAASSQYFEIMFANEHTNRARVSMVVVHYLSPQLNDIQVRCRNFISKG